MDPDSKSKGISSLRLKSGISLKGNFKIKTDKFL